MARRPRANDDDISLFPFLSIIACVIGVLTMMIATLALAQTDTPDVALIEKYEQTQKELAQAEERIEKCGDCPMNPPRSSCRTKRRQLTMTASELQSLLEELERVESELAEQKEVEIVIPPIDERARETGGGSAIGVGNDSGANRAVRKRAAEACRRVRSQRDGIAPGKRIEFHAAFRRVRRRLRRDAQLPDAKTNSGRGGGSGPGFHRPAELVVNGKDDSIVFLVRSDALATYRACKTTL